MMNNKSLYFNTPFKVKSGCEDEDDTLKIEGYASTNSLDRHGDVVEASAWKNPAAMENYISNPIILAYHDHTKPIGTMIDYTTDEKGLRIVAKISKAAGEVYDLIKDGVLRTFSIGFMVKDAEWDDKKDIFRIKDVELFETSVVSVPANASAGFDLSKSFGSDDEFINFKQQFVKSNENGDDEMSTNDNKAPSGLSAEEVAAIVAKQLAEKEAQEAEKRKREKEIEDRVSGEVTAVAERLEKEMQAKLDAAGQNEQKLEKTVVELAEEARQAKEELEALRKSKMEWNGTAQGEIDTTERDTAILLSKCMGIPLEATKFGSQVIEKAGANVPGADWEETFNTNILMDLREELKLEPLFRKIMMPTPSVRFPANPEAAYAEWVTGTKGTANTAVDADTRTGAAQDQQLREIILTSKTLATKSYIGYEEEEDAILPIMPIVREALIRRMARASDLSLTMGTASGLTGAASGIAGLVQFGNSTAQAGNIAAGLAIQDMLDARKRLGRWGLDTSKLVYLVDIAGYYDLLNDETAGSSFKTMDTVGDRATLLTGQLASLGGVPVIVTEAWPTLAASSERAACVYTGNYMIGEQRSLKVEQDASVEWQTKLLVATRRMAFQEMESGVGCEIITNAAA